MATVEYYTAQRPNEYKDQLTQVVATGLNEFLAEAVHLGGGSATLREFIKLTGVFQAPVRNYQISVNGSDVIADGISYSLEQGAEFVAGKIALDYAAKAVAAADFGSFAVGFAIVTYPVASAVAAALVAHELFSLFGVQDGSPILWIVFSVPSRCGSRPLTSRETCTGASYGGGLGGLREIEAVQGWYPAQRNRRNDRGRQSDFSGTSLQLQQLHAEGIQPCPADRHPAPEDRPGCPRLDRRAGRERPAEHNSDVFIPHFNEFTIVNDQAKIAIEIRWLDHGETGAVGARHCDQRRCQRVTRIRHCRGLRKHGRRLHASARLLDRSKLAKGIRLRRRRRRYDPDRRGQRSDFR